VIRFADRTISNQRHRRGKGEQAPAWCLSLLVTCHHAGLPVVLGEFDLDTHEDLLSLPQSNFPPGQFALSQTDDYLARRNQTITRSIATNAKTMTSGVVSLNINRNRRMDVLPHQGRESKSILPRKTGLFKIAQFLPASPLPFSRTIKLVFAMTGKANEKTGGIAHLLDGARAYDAKQRQRICLSTRRSTANY
jgi:hypothetical protein